jgi:hypothetical protein
VILKGIIKQHGCCMYQIQDKFVFIVQDFLAVAENIFQFARLFFASSGNS